MAVQFSVHVLVVVIGAVLAIQERDLYPSRVLLPIYSRDISSGEVPLGTRIVIGKTTLSFFRVSMPSLKLFRNLKQNAIIQSINLIFILCIIQYMYAAILMQRVGRLGEGVEFLGEEGFSVSLGFFTLSMLPVSKQRFSVIESTDPILLEKAKNGW
jgi:hypothetical protein